MAWFDVETNNLTDYQYQPLKQLIIPYQDMFQTCKKVMKRKQSYKIELCKEQFLNLKFTIGNQSP